MSTNMEETNKEKEDRKRKIKQSVEDGTFDYDEAVKKWTQCCQFIRHKKRFCNLERSPNSKYCGAHRPPGEDAGNRIQAQSKKQGIDVQRCPCPIDPSHSIYLHNLEAHVQICNIKTRNDLLKKEPYYLENCNSGTSDEFLNIEGITTTMSTNVVDPDELVKKIIKAFKNVETDRFHNPHDNSDTSAAGASLTTASTESTYDHIEHDILKTIASGQSSEDSLRHAKQDYRIILQMIQSGLITYPENNERKLQQHNQQRDTVFCELGAGKGMLGLAVHSVQPTSTIVFVERSGTKRKADKMLRSKQGSFYRARMDIRHCLVPKLPGITKLTDQIDFNNLPKNESPALMATSTLLRDTSSDSHHKNVIVIAKHLCGCATDLAIRSMKYLCTTRATTAADAVGSCYVNSQAWMKGLAIATCCHHACNWADYVGKKWFLQQQFTEAEFDVLKLWSGWAHTLKACGGSGDGDNSSSSSKNDNNNDNNDNHIKKPEKESNELASPESTAFEDGDGEHALSGDSKESLNAVIRPANITRKEMARYGWMTKRIFDHGRMVYLRDTFHLQSAQVQYCESNLSPENIMLLATNDDAFPSQY